jgi:coenzyme F420-0:L-glutamate ligase / coenzyme F420-1:gamma-L-glutamate ligase
LIQIIPVRISDDIVPGDDLATKIGEGCQREGIEILDRDIIVVAQKVVSKAEGRIVDLANVKPSSRAKRIAKANRKDPRVVELILRESRSLVKVRKGVIITETHHGFVCANSGVDQSNAKNESTAILLPIDPDKSALEIRKNLIRNYGKQVAVIVTDTFGRPFRNGQTNVAIGVAGIAPMKSYIGTSDMYGKILRVTEIAIVDEISCAAELVMGKTNRVPVVIVRGCGFESSQKATVGSLLRTKKKDLFR